MLSKQLEIIESAREKWVFILLTGGIAFLFINIFEPFGTYSSASKTDTEVFIEVSLAILVVLLALSFSQFTLRPVFKVISFTFLTLGIWFILDMVLIPLLWTGLALLENEQAVNLEMVLDNFLACLFLIAPPYIGTLIFLSYRKRLRDLKNRAPVSDQEAGGTPQIIAFNDKGGKEKIKLQLSDLLYLESSDNYVNIFFRSNGEMKKSMVRNTIKNLEDELAPHGIVRCHRSYLINPQNIIRLEKGRLFMKGSGDISVPVSKSHTSEIGKLLS